MKLIIIHGPPAAGKLTVATELSRLIGYKLFHNHLSIDCVKPIFEFGSPSFLRLIEFIRFETIAEAARQNVNLIHTFVYAKGPDDEHFARLIASAEDNGGEAHLVLLHCHDDELRNRIGNESRVSIGKLTDPESVEASRQKHDLRSPLPGRATLIIDTSNTDPKRVAQQIVDTFGLVEEQDLQNGSV